QRRLALDIDPLVPQPRDGENWRAVARREVVRLLAARRVLPFVIAGYGNEAAAPPERVAKERLLGHGLDSSVESRGPELLERLAPPCRHQPPAHGREHALATA